MRVRALLVGLVLLLSIGMAFGQDTPTPPAPSDTPTDVPTFTDLPSDTPAAPPSDTPSATFTDVPTPTETASATVTAPLGDTPTADTATPTPSATGTTDAVLPTADGAFWTPTVTPTPFAADSASAPLAFSAASAPFPAVVVYRTIRNPGDLYAAILESNADRQTHYVLWLEPGSYALSTVYLGFPLQRALRAGTHFAGRACRLPERLDSSGHAGASGGTGGADGAVRRTGVLLRPAAD